MVLRTLWGGPRIGSVEPHACCWKAATAQHDLGEVRRWLGDEVGRVLGGIDCEGFSLS